MAIRYRSLPIITSQERERFWSLVNKEPGQGPKGDCWEWQGNRPQGLYGQFYVRPETHPRKAGRGRACSAHRIAYFLQTNDDPVGLNVNHECDNPACVRGEHLWKGTPKENTQDALRKGRIATGDRAGARTHPEKLRRGKDHWSYGKKELLFNGTKGGGAKISEDAVRQIRTATGSNRAIGRRYGLTHSQIKNIKTGKSWGWIK